MLPDFGTTSMYPCSSFQPAGPASLTASQPSSEVPSNRMIASEGGVAPSLKVPEVTTGGCGRSPSCTCHFVPGMIGVS